MFGDVLSLLALYGLLVALTLVAQATGAVNRLGMGYMMSARDEKRELGRHTARLDRALANSVTAMALFAPAVLVVAAKGQDGTGAVTAAQAFLLARVVYLPAYVLGIAGVRTLAWSVGFVATIALYVIAL